MRVDPFALISDVAWLGIPAAFVLGVLLTANPLALPMLGTAVGLGSAGALGGGLGGTRIVAAFGAGMVAVYTLVGLAASRVDELTERVLRPYAGMGYLLLAGDDGAEKGKEHAEGARGMGRPRCTSRLVGVGVPSHSEQGEEAASRCGKEGHLQKPTRPTGERPARTRHCHEHPEPVAGVGHDHVEGALGASRVGCVPP